MEETKLYAKETNLVQKSSTCDYKIVIPKEVEKKIRFACQEVWDTEWSGILFFTYEGSFESNDLVIKCKDIYIMDIGNQTYTEFDMNPDVISYMTAHQELLDCQIGLIHSHAGMSTFFSGTDQQTLKEEGKDRNNFVSLIVNNAGNYTAAITRRVVKKLIRESESYKFFDKGMECDTREYLIEADDVEWFYLKVEKEGGDYFFSDMAERLREIKQVKKEESKKTQESSFDTNYWYKDNPNVINSELSGTDRNSETKEAQSSLFDKSGHWENEDSIHYGQVTFNKDTIKSLVMQLVTGSIILSKDSKIILPKWVKSMTTFYEKRFGTGKECMKSFEMWADTYTEYLTWYARDENLEELGFDETEICAICAYDMIEELKKLPNNISIDGYINSLQKYII